METRTSGNPTNVTTVPIGAVVIEDSFQNFRGVPTDQDESLGVVAQSMAEQGLLHPIVVVDRGDGSYGLRAGFRRHAAAVLLGWTEILAVILDRSTPEEEACWVNLVENQIRRPLSSWALAHAAVEMMSRFGISGAEFARKTDSSVAHVNNCVRLYKGLPVEILRDWQIEHPLLTFKKLEVYYAMMQRDAIEAWAQEKLGLGSPKRPRNPHPRATSRQLERLFVVVENHPTMPEEGKKAARAVLQYAIARTETAGITDRATLRRVLRRTRKAPGRPPADISSGNGPASGAAAPDHRSDANRASKRAGRIGEAAVRSGRGIPE